RRLSLHDALPICVVLRAARTVRGGACSPPTRTAPGAPRYSAAPSAAHRHCAGIVALERELDIPRRAMPVLANLHEQLAGGLFAVLVEEDHDICVLLDAAGFAEVSDAGKSTVPAGAVSVQLGQEDDGYLHFLRQHLERAGESGDQFVAGDG